MVLWQNDDYETPIEEYPGYLGLIWDGTFLAGEELRPLKGLDLLRYSELVDEHGGMRHLKLTLATGSTTITFKAYDEIAHILDQLPTVTVYQDYDPPGAGPASGTGYYFFIGDDVSDFDLKASITALVAALKSDLDALEANH
jgi:hypothetical protein